MSHLLADLRFAFRGLRKAPLFTSVVALSIAFGIAANTAVFTLVDQVLLRPLPVIDPKQLVQVDAADTESYGGGMGDGIELSYALYKDLRDNNDVFAGMFCRFPVELQISQSGRGERLLGELVSGTYFPQLGVTPVAGRLFTADDDAGAGRPVAVLSYGYGSRDSMATVPLSAATSRSTDTSTKSSASSARDSRGWTSANRRRCMCRSPCSLESVPHG